jgi:Ca2+-binding RTX toxin-like protein
MPQLTVVGPGGSQVDVSVGTAQNASVAAQILDLISNQVAHGNLTPYEYDGIGPLDAPTGPGYLVVTGPGSAAPPADTPYVVDVAQGPVLLQGGTASTQAVVSDSPLTYYANTGVGTVVASGGGSDIITALTGGGDHVFVTDGDNNRVIALSGDDSIYVGPGDCNNVVLGSGNDLVVTQGQASVVAGSGHDTVQVVSGTAAVQGGSGTLLFANGSGASTVFGGTGSDTITGGDGGGVYHGGTAGDNLLMGGLNATTLFGGGSGDTLIGLGCGNNLLQAGSGSETLIGAGSGSETLIGGSGADSIAGGFGQNTLVAGSGGGTLTGGMAGNLYEFTGQSQGNFVVTDFMQGVDKIALSGSDCDGVSDVLNSQQSSGGSVTVTLNDETKVTFTGVSHLDRSSFS